MHISVLPYTLTPSQRRNPLRITLWNADTENLPHFKNALERILRDRFGDREEIVLNVQFKNKGGYKIDYSKIKDVSFRRLVKNYLDISCPIYC